MWWLLSLATGFFVASQGAIAKRHSTGRRALVITWAASAFSLPFFAAYLWLGSRSWPSVEPIFWGYLAINTVLLLSASILYYNAIKVGELSRDLPLLSLTPIFMLLTSWLMLDQALTLEGAFAIFVIVSGCIVLQKTPTLRWRAMLPAIVREPGSRRMLLVALIWSITANVDKLCIDAVGPVWFAALINTSLALVMLPVAWLWGGNVVATTRTLILPLVAIGILHAASALCQMPAIEMAPHVGYVVALKRGGMMLTGILWGMLLYRERNIGWRLVGAAWILCGLLLLSMVV